jgi:preprotein translocase subunit SecA
MLVRVGFDENQAIRSRTFTRSIESAQKKVEGNNYDMRKSLLDYDNVMNEQREIIYARRNEILDQDSISDRTEKTFEKNVENLINDHLDQNQELQDFDKSEIVEYLNTNLLKTQRLDEHDIIAMKKVSEVKEFLIEKVTEDYRAKVKDVPTEIINDFEKAVALRVIDESWIDHINAMEHLREGIGLRGYGQTNPLQAYTMEGYNMFDELMESIESKISIFLLKAEVRQNTARKEQNTSRVVRSTTNKESEKQSPVVKDKKVGRNDPCPCGSGKKYKNCCGK